ncbi:MAG: glutamate-1-semialdehyde 2,1-aminomutase [Micropruina sp.]|uniref:glutamate-1-semialdehyde 2,1-aminomutase n=1 Tax=Micropruina sp. TaxID=2737536 RepID=UPI0039E6203E
MSLFQRACRVIPGGVSSPVRAFGSVGGDPVFIARASGPYLYDTNGREYVDAVGSWGPALLGHAHPEVVAAVQAAAARGLSFGAPTQAEVELAEAVRTRVPEAEKVRFVSTGTEACMTAIRLARGATGRDLVVKFAGCYHGHSDGLLAAAGSGVATQGLPGSAGVTAATAAQTIVVPYNDPDALEAAFAAHPDRIAAVITEPAPANMGVVPPRPGFNSFLREVTRRHGALLIFDEVLTGFRVGYRGWWGLEQSSVELVGTTPLPEAPDLFTFGKVVGGGMPLAAIGGRAELMDLLAPVGPVYQAGTLSGNPLATAAGITTLALADDAVYARVDEVSAALQTAIGAAMDAAGVPHRVQAAGSLFTVFFGDFDGSIDNYPAAQQQDSAAFARFFHAMLDAGVALPPSGYEAWFLSAAHDDAVLNRVVDALPAAAQAAGRS